MSMPADRSPARRVAPPIPFRWNGETMEPVGRFGREADRYYVVGETYRLAPHRERSDKSHGHLFAEIHEAWQNLPEPWATLFPTEDRLRKYALVMAGFRSEKVVVCPSRAFAAKLHRELIADYDWASVDGNVLTLFTADSQSYRSADRRAFQAQKDGVLAVLAGLIGTTPETLASNAGRAA